MSRFNETVFALAGTISKLEIQKKRKDRVNVHLDGEYAFSCHVDLVLSYRLDKGLAIDAALTQTLVEADDALMAYQYGLRYALGRMVSITGVRRKLTLQGFDPNSVERAIEKLIENDYVNDERYAVAYCEMKKAILGRHRMVQELMRQGVDRTLANRVVESLVDSEDQFEEALKMARKKLQQCGGALSPANYNKVYGFLARKGYGQDVLRHVMSDLKKNPYDQEDLY